jgi:hypothetical protein
MRATWLTVIPMPEDLPTFIAPEYLLPLSEEPANGAHSDKDEYSLQSATIFL